MVHTLFRISFLAGSVSALALNAAAQEVPASAFELGPIVVYGDRTTTDADRSLSSVAIVGEKELASPTVSTWRDSFRLMANVQAGDWTENGVIIRGVNSEGQTPGGLGAPLASLYIDGVQQTVNGTRRGARGTFDTEQFEVFRGPQSTLSGRAALAGAMYLRTRDPSFYPSGAAQLTYGDNDHRQVGLAYGNALGETVAFRLSGEWAAVDTDLNYPSYERFERYDDFATDEYYTLRGKLLWMPGDDNRTRVLFSASHSYDRPTSNDIAGPNWSSKAPSFGARRGDIWGDISPDWVSAYGLIELPAYQEVREGTVDNFGLEITHEISPSLLFTSMTGYTLSNTTRNSINVGTPGEFLTVTGAFDQNLLTQEFRLNYAQGPWEAVGGYYISYEDQKAHREQQLLSYDQSRNNGDILNQAVFGEASYEVAPGWRLIGGGRIDYVSQDLDAWAASNGATTTDTASSYHDTVFIPKFGVEYDVAPNQTLGLVYQRGYRPGGAAVYVADGSQYSYAPEWTDVVELSWRARMMDNRLRLAANAFYQNWNDQQVEIQDDPADWKTSRVVNAGKSTSYGGELEVSYQATERLNLFSSIGLLHTEFDDFVASGNDYSGQAFPAAPGRTLVLGYLWGGDTGWFSLGNVKYTSSFNSRIEAGIAEPIELDPYTTVDLSAGYAWNGARLTAYATNLFDAEYFTYEYGPGTLATLGDRREIGIRLDYTF